MQIIKMKRIYRQSGNMSSSESTQNVADGFAEHIRDPLREALDPQYWQVTDVVAWSGYNRSFGTCFLVRALDGAGNLTGDEWMFATAMYIYSSTRYMFYTIDDAWGNNDPNAPANYWEGLQDSSNTLNDFNGEYYLLHSYAPDGFPGFEFDDDGHIVGGSGGDGDLPAPSAGITPYSNIDAFLGDGVFKGVGFEVENTQPSSWAVMVNPDNPSLTVLYGYGEFMRESPTFVSLSGDNLIEPYDPADTNKKFFGFFQRDQDEINLYYNEFNRRARVIDLDGNMTTVDYRWNGNITGSNSPRPSDGKYCWEPVAITGGSIHKGYLDPKFIREVGGNDHNMGQLFKDSDGDVYYKFHRHLAVQWPENTMPWPYGFGRDGGEP